MAMGTARRLELTERARKAAGQGRWDIVRDCYRERGKLLAEATVPAEEGEQLIRIDRQIAEQARLAQAALASLMHEAVTIRQRLKGLRQGQGGPSTNLAVFRLEA